MLLHEVLFSFRFCNPCLPAGRRIPKSELKWANFLWMKPDVGIISLYLFVVENEYENRLQTEESLGVVGKSGHRPSLYLFYPVF
jgi:hypothetical protein